MAIEPTRRRRSNSNKLVGAASKYQPGVQREKYSPSPKPSDECRCTRATAAKPSIGELTHLYPYYDADEKRLFSRFRYKVTSAGSTEGDKTFRYCEHYDRTNPQHVSLLYGQHRVKEAVKNDVPATFLAEGESDCEPGWALEDAYVTTTHLGTRFPMEAAEHFRGYQGTVYIVVDRDHLNPDHQARFNHENPDKRMDYPGAAAALRKRRALTSVGVRCFFREARVGKDLRDHLEAGKKLSDLRKVSLDEIKARAPKEAANKRIGTMRLSESDKPEGPGMANFVRALEAKGFFLEKIGPTRYKTNCPHPDHDDNNPSFEFEQGAKGVVATCESNDCTVGKGMGEICKSLGIRLQDIFDNTKSKGVPEGVKLDLVGQPQFAPSYADPMEVARYIQDEWVGDDGVSGLMYTDEVTWYHNGVLWKPLSDGQLRGRLYRRMDSEYMLKLDGEEWKPVRWAPTSGKIGNLMDTVRAINSKPEVPDWDTWLEPPVYASRHLSMENGIFDLETHEVREHTPRYFNTWSLPYSYDPSAECPSWLGFLSDVFEGDEDSIRTLRQWFGYVVSGRTNLEKILTIVGPPRSGKGTVYEALTAVVGSNSSQSFTMRHLSGDFGLENFIGKRLVCDPDMRHALKAEDMQNALERLLSISANDPVVVQRKNRVAITTKLGVCAMILSNELPRFADASNASNSRIVLLKMRKSFLGSEDIHLKARIVKEAAGIFNWALEGLKDLEESGRLLQPSSAQNYIDAMEEGASRHEQFLQQFCVIGAVGDEDSWCHFDHLKQLWKSWCEANETKPGNPQWIMRDLTPIITRLGGEAGRAYKTEDGVRFRIVTGLSIKESSGPKEKML